MDYTKYGFNEDLEDNEVPRIYGEDAPSEMPEDGILHSLGVADIKRFCGDLSGNDVSVSYRSYDYDPEEEKDIDEMSAIKDIEGAVTNISYDTLNPSVMLLDIIFKEAGANDIKLMYASLNSWRGRMSREGNLVPIFQIHIENDDVSLTLVNPLIWYLTRQTPVSYAKDEADENGNIIGGNIIRLLVNMELATFEVSV